MKNLEKRYLIFDRSAHSVIFFVRADTLTDAVWTFIANENDDAVRQADGSIRDGRVAYSHPLAYIETNYKAHEAKEWQIRELPEWTWQDQFNEIFCGEGIGGPDTVIDDCRKLFVREFPRSRARAFIWYVQGGVLVTFFRKQRRTSPWGSPQITILRRYFHHWDGKQLTLEEWNGDYEQLVKFLKIEPFHWRWPVRT